MAAPFTATHRGPLPRLSHLLGALAMALAPIALGATTEEIIAKGRYLAEIGGCQSCHTQPDAPAYSGARYLDTPFGQVSTPNLTSDPASGLGQWTPEEFYRALHDGIGRTGQFLYPAMPYPWYARITREDALAIQIYLFSLPPVLKYRPPNHLLFPYSVRTSLAGWRERFFKPADFVADAQRTAQLNRGDYLVNGLARCTLCHGADATATRVRKPFQGGVINDWWSMTVAPDLLVATAQWSEADIAAFLKTGVVPGASSPAAPIPESVHGLGNASTDDLQAIAAYVKSAPAGLSPTAPAVFDGAQAKGGQGYLDRCAACHGMDGNGIPEVIPSLVRNTAVVANDPQEVLKAVLGGRVAAGTYAPMAAVGADMTDDDVADTATFVRQHFGDPAAPTVAPAIVAAMRESIDTPMNASRAASCTPVPPGPITVGMNQPLAGIPAAVATLDPKNPWPRLLLLAGRVDHYIPTASLAERTNVLTGIYCKVLLRNAAADRATRATMLGAFSQQMYNSIRDYPSIIIHSAQ